MSLLKLEKFIQEIQVHLIQTHSKIFDWFLEEEAVKNYRPKDNGWTIVEILEHIALTSHFLLILIDKGAEKALRNVKGLSLDKLIEEFDYDVDKLSNIGMHKSFSWMRPEHMKPTGTKSEFEIQQEMVAQINRCLLQLESLKNGEGLRHTTMMSVNELGKINVYEYIYFLSKHGERHIQQMIENRNEF